MSEEVTLGTRELIHIINTLMERMCDGKDVMYVVTRLEATRKGDEINFGEFEWTEIIKTEVKP